MAISGANGSTKQETKSEGNWIPLMDFAMRKGVSLSTLRRHIKANKILFKVEGGRYLIWDESSNDSAAALELQRAREEIAELKTLIAFYEESLGRSHELR